jgi:hypothetical protein
MLPSVVVSASPCISDGGPNLAWAWADAEQRDKRWAEAEELGIAAGRRAGVLQWLEDAYAGGLIRWPNVLTSLGAARTFAVEFDLPCGELVLLGIGLPSSHLAEFPWEEEGGSGIREVLERRTTLAGDGRRLGYEVLGLSYSTFHSWLCNHLECEAAAELEVRPNENGFLDTLADAERVAQWANEGERGEPVFWQPWLVVRYGWS